MIGENVWTGLILLYVVAIAILVCVGSAVHPSARRLIPSLSTRKSSGKHARHVRFILTTVVCLSITALFLLPLVEAWSSSTYSNYQSIGGLLPWSDSSGWLHGIHHLLREGEIEHWSVRRPLHLIYMSNLSVAAALNLQGMLILRTLVLAAACCLFIREISRSFGRIAALAVLAILSSFAYRFTPLILTEVPGLTFGLVATALLWRGVRSENLPSYASGGLILAIGLAIRTGAVFVLAGVLLWPLVGLRGSYRTRAQWVTLSTMAVVAGIALSWIWKALLYSGDNIPGENFAYTLYGLAHGGLPWTVFYDHFDTSALTEGEQASLAYREAVSRIKERPLSLLRGFATFTVNYLEHLFTYIRSSFRPYVLGAFCAGIGVAVLNIRKKESRFLLLLLLGVAGTSPIIFWGYDAYRALIVTAPIDAMFVAAAISTVTHLSRGRNIPFTDPTTAQTGNDRVLPIFAMFLIAMVTVLPVLSMSLVGKPTTDPITCDEGQLSALLDIGADSPYLHLVDRKADEVGWAPRVGGDRFRKSVADSRVEIATILSSMKTGQILAHGYDLLRPRAAPTWLVMSDDSFDSGPGLYAVCGVRMDTPQIVIEVASARPIQAADDNSGE